MAILKNSPVGRDRVKNTTRGSSASLKPERMSAFRRRIRRDEEGQVLVLAAVGMTAICGMAGFAVDVGAFYQAHR